MIVVPSNVFGLSATSATTWAERSSASFASADSLSSKSSTWRGTWRTSTHKCSRKKCQVTNNRWTHDWLAGLKLMYFYCLLSWKVVSKRPHHPKSLKKLEHLVRFFFLFWESAQSKCAKLCITELRDFHKNAMRIVSDCRIFKVIHE